MYLTVGQKTPAQQQASSSPPSSERQVPLRHLPAINYVKPICFEAYRSRLPGGATRIAGVGANKPPTDLEKANPDMDLCQRTPTARIGRIGYTARLFEVIEGPTARWDWHDVGCPQRREEKKKRKKLGSDVGNSATQKYWRDNRKNSIEKKKKKKEEKDMKACTKHGKRELHTPKHRAEAKKKTQKKRRECVWQNEIQRTSKRARKQKKRVVHT
jgi:hypothetical protein